MRFQLSKSITKEKRHKYGAVKTVVDGFTFSSKKEAKRYGELKLMKLAGKILGFSLQPRFPYDVEYLANGKRYMVKRMYIADFEVYYPDGSCVIEDVKGVRTAEYKRKKKIIEKLYGIIIIEK